MLETKFNKVDEELDMFYGSSVRKNHVIMIDNLLTLNCYYPTMSFDSPKMNQPLCQFGFHMSRRSPFMTKEDAVKLVKALEHLIETSYVSEMTHLLSCGRIKVSDTSLWFPESAGIRYNTKASRPGDFIKGIIKALKAFLNEEGEEFPFISTSEYKYGVNTDTMFLLTHNGEVSYSTLPSYMSYKHASDGKGSELIIRYGTQQFVLHEGSVRGIPYVTFLQEMVNALSDIESLIDGGKDHHTVRLFENDDRLNKYNCYISMIKEYRGTMIVLNTDLAPTRSKTVFLIERDNLKHLITFLSAAIIYLEKK